MTTLEAKVRGRSIVNGLALAVVVIATVYAAFMSQLASSKVQDAQDQRDAENMCTSSILFNTVQALNERTTFTLAQSRSNIELQQAQAEYLRIVIASPNASTDAQAASALRLYFDKLTNFNTVVSKNIGKAQVFPYPTQESYSACLARARK